jgi:hypothetical protein
LRVTAFTNNAYFALKMLSSFPNDTWLSDSAFSKG